MSVIGTAWRVRSMMLTKPDIRLELWLEDALRRRDPAAPLRLHRHHVPCLLYTSGNWPHDWPAAPEPLSLGGGELMQKDIDRAARAFGSDHPLVSVEQGDMTEVSFRPADVITILDALHYVDHDCQKDILQRIRGALPPGGVFLTRVGDAGAGLPYHLCNWVDHAVIFVRGHRLPRLYCRRLSEWVELLERLDFVIDSEPMNEGKPFANVMLVCRVPE